MSDIQPDPYIDPIAAEHVTEYEDEALNLVRDALFLRMYGERPPGAPPDKPEAETWADWDHRAETLLRAQPAARPLKPGMPARLMDGPL